MSDLRQSTDYQDCCFGFFLSTSDGNTEMTALSIANTDVRLFKPGASVFVSKHSGGGAHMSMGNYKFSFDSVDTSVAGELEAIIHMTSALPVKRIFNVLPADVYDAKYAGSYFKTNVQQIKNSDAMSQIVLAAGSALNAYDAPTYAEMISAFAALDDISYNSVVSAVASALNTYDAPTFTEMTSALVNLSRLDVSVSSRSSHSAADTWAVLTRTITGGVLNSSIPSVSEIRAEMDNNSVKLSGIIQRTNKIPDYPASSSDIPTDYAMQLTASAIKVTTDNLSTMMENVSGYRFNSHALAEAPSGTGGDATLANQLSMIATMADIKGVGFATVDDSLKAIRDRGDVAWVTGGGMAGSNTVALTIKDGSGNNIVEAAIEVYDAVGTTFYEKKFSNSSGQGIFQLDDGSYTIKIHKSGFTFTDTVIVVSGALAQAITGTALVITAPSDPTLCRIYVYVKYPNNTIPSALITGLKVVELPEFISGIGYAGDLETGQYDSVTGLLYWDVVQGATARISVKELGIDNKKIIIPAATTAEIEDLI